MSSRSYTPGLAILEPNLQTNGKTTIHAIPSSCLVQRLQGLRLLGSPVLEPDLQPEDTSTVAAKAPLLGSLMLLGWTVLKPDLQPTL